MIKVLRLFKVADQRSHLDLFVEFLNIDPELLVGINQVIYSAAGVQYSGMVLIAAVKAYGCQ